MRAERGTPGARDVSATGGSPRRIFPRRASSAEIASAEEVATLYRANYHRFVRFAEAITRDPEEARDAVQEGFASALRGLGRYGARGSFEGWVWRCVLNAARMSRRRSARRAPPPIDDPPADRGDSAEWESRLLDRVGALPERQRLVLFLRYFADLSYDGIAEALGVAPGTVAAALHAAHRELREGLKEDSHE